MSTIGNAHLRQLAVFACVVDTKSFAAAARQLHSSRSRVSEQVSQLEGVLGVRLLQRSTRQLIVTSEGHEVYEQARRLPQILQEIEGIINNAEPSGRVAITMSHDIAHNFFMPLLETFLSAYPKIQVDLTLNDGPVDIIAEQIDLAIRIGFPKDNSLIGRVLHEDRLQMFASPNYLARTGTPKTIDAIEKCRWITLSQHAFGDVQRYRQKNKTIDVRPQEFHRCNSPLMMIKMAIGGLGIAPLLPSVIKGAIDNKQLVRVLPKVESEPLVFSLVYPSRHQVPQRTRALIDHIINSNMFGPTT